MVDRDVNDNPSALINGEAKCFVSGYALLMSGINFQKVKYLAVVDSHQVKGTYRDKEAKIVDMSAKLNERNSRHKDKLYRVELTIADYNPINPFKYGLDTLARRGTILTRNEFCKYTKGLY